MKILIVGGAVRDILLGRSPSDFDYVVEGDPEDFLREFHEARLVGNDFPVFLVDKEEYAFARSERKSGRGHKGFSTAPTTLKEDLLRRDLTINAMAMCPETGEIVEADNRCSSDLYNRYLRHTSEAFREDPLRVFRVARFAAQLPEFTVADETLILMEQMQSSLAELSAERVFGELRKALEAPKPRRFFEVLKDCACLEPWFKELQDLINVPVGPPTGKHAGERDCFDHTMNVVSNAYLPHLRFAGLCHDFGKALSENPPIHHGHDEAGAVPVHIFCTRLKVPKLYYRMAILFTEQHMRMHKILEMRAGKAVDLITLIGLDLNHFLQCSIADGMTATEAKRILRKGMDIHKVKLPEKYIGRGKICREIMHQERCKVWKSRGKEL